MRRSNPFVCASGVWAAVVSGCLSRGGQFIPAADGGGEGELWGWAAENQWQGNVYCPRRGHSPSVGERIFTFTSNLRFFSYLHCSRSSTAPVWCVRAPVSRTCSCSFRSSSSRPCWPRAPLGSPSWRRARASCRDRWVKESQRVTRKCTCKSDSRLPRRYIVWTSDLPVEPIWNVQSGHSLDEFVPNAKWPNNWMWNQEEMMTHTCFVVGGGACVSPALWLLCDFCSEWVNSLWYVFYHGQFCLWRSMAIINADSFAIRKHKLFTKKNNFRWPELLLRFSLLRFVPVISYNWSAECGFTLNVFGPLIITMYE